MSMDGQPNALPPITAPATPGLTPFPAQISRPMVAPNPVGRPSNDPDQQQQRAERTQAARRLDAVTPTRAKDHKLLVFRTDGNGRSRGRPVLTLLITEVEAYLNPIPAEGRDDALDDLITQKLPESCDDGLYKCQWYDKNNRPQQDPPPWEVQIGNTDDADQGGDAEVEEFEDQQQPGTMPVQPSFQPPAPPPPAQLDLANVGRVFREEREQESRRGNETMTLVMSMQQQSQQMMATLVQMQTASQQQQMQFAQQQEERDRQRRAEFRTTLLTTLPILMPFIIQMFGPKEKSGMSAEMTALLELVKGMASNKGSDAALMENMIKMNGEMTKNQLALQAQGASAAVTMQAEASSLVFKNLMNTMKELMENKPEPAPKDNSTMEMIGRIAGPIIAQVMQNNQQQQQPPEAPAAAQVEGRVARRMPVASKMPPPDAPPAAAPPAAAPAPAAEASAPRRTGRRVATRPAAQQTDPNAIPDNKRIEGCLKTVREMSFGKYHPNDRWKGVRWIAHWLPAPMLDAIKAKDKDKVQELGMVAALSNADILQWITDSENQEFLTDVLEDVRLLITGEATEALAEASVIKGGQFIQRRRAAMQAAQERDREAVRNHNNPPDTGEGNKSVLDASLPTTPNAPPVTDAQPVTPPAAQPPQTPPPPPAG